MWHSLLNSELSFPILHFVLEVQHKRSKLFEFLCDCNITVKISWNNKGFNWLVLSLLDIIVNFDNICLDFGSTFIQSIHMSFFNKSKLPTFKVKWYMSNMNGTDIVLHFWVAKYSILFFNMCPFNNDRVLMIFTWWCL